MNTFLEKHVKEEDDYKLVEIPFKSSESEAAAWAICQRIANAFTNLIHENVKIRKVHPQ